MKNVRDAGFSRKRGGNAGSGPPLPDPQFSMSTVLFIFSDQDFIDPTFFDIFVCGPLQSFVVNVCS